MLTAEPSICSQVSSLKNGWCPENQEKLTVLMVEMTNVMAAAAYKLSKAVKEAVQAVITPPDEDEVALWKIARDETTNLQLQIDF